MAKILIIDDEAPILDLMTQLCKGMGHEVLAFQTGREGVDALKQESPDLAIVDLRIPDMDGLAIVEKCAADHPDMPIVMVTGFGTVETAVEAMKLGAFDYMTKPFELDDLQRTINRGLKHAGKGSAAPVVVKTDPIRPTSSIIGDSPEMKSILQMVEKIADNDSPTLLEGEFGSGKQMVARTIHDRSRRKDEPFKVLACSALPEDLLEAELFGGDGRASTIFNRAHGGTVVLEEINMLPIRLQSQLDTFLEDVNTRRMQGSLPETLDFRFIATSTEPLETWVKDGKFREDLYYRVSVIPFQIPPLRARKEDIPLLADHFLDNYSKLAGSKKKEIDKYAMKLLVSYGWPGNVGELQNAIERACAFADGDRVRPIDLPPKVSQKIEISDEENEALKHQLPIGTKLSDYIKKQEKMFIRETLKYNEGSREKTASMLGVSIATLYRKMGLKLERDKMLSS
ncbi:MAG: sigma-54-dependent transcriptional regulator [Verrucomicrobiales bacterium]